MKPLSPSYCSIRSRSNFSQSFGDTNRAPYLAHDLGEEFVDASVAAKIESYFKEGYAQLV